jgi:general L-amino acid transport system permease protein
MTAEALPPPRSITSPRAWLHRNLFSSLTSSLVTGLVAGLLILVAIQVGDWALTQARWDVVTGNMRLFLIGQFPADQSWRVWLSLLLLSALTGVSAPTYGRTTRTLAVSLSALNLMIAGFLAVSPPGAVPALALLANAAIVWVGMAVGHLVRIPRRALVVGWIASLPMTWLLLNGVAGTPLLVVSSHLWGGLLLTIVLAAVGIFVSFPLGVLLALGRRSSMPAVRLVSTGYIELVRAVPLVTILFMADIMLPFFLPGEVRIERVTRAMGGLVLFSAAYVAENVRGGLQAIPTGQLEAAHALGLGTVQTNLFIVLPQALRSVIPANVGLFISLLKDTTLVSIIGLAELLGIGQAVLAQPDSLGAHLEVFAFIGIIFFVLCYAMSQASYRLERQLGVGVR